MASMKKKQPTSWSAKKRKKATLDKTRDATKVVIWTEMDRWLRVKEERGLKKDVDVAKLLLDSYDAMRSNPIRTTSGPSHSTPAMLGRHIAVPSCSEISEDTSDVQMSGVEEICEEEIMVRQQETSTSFINPFDLTIDISEEAIDEEDKDDEDYEPSFNITIGPQRLDMISDVEEEDYSEDWEEEEEEAVVLGPGIQRILQESDKGRLTDETCLVYMQELLKLAKIHVSDTCPTCQQLVTGRPEFIGSAVYIIWECLEGHMIHRWCSQPVLKRGLHGGDLMLAAAILTSGNNMEKVALLASHLKLHFIHAVTYHRIQTFYLVPAIEQFWDRHLASVHREFHGKKLVLMGDGRMDSPGHCAQYCTYTAMEMESKKIVSLVTMDKRETEKKSTNMEKAAFIKTMEGMKTKVQVAEVVTDAHMQIGSVMKKQYPAVKHSHDIWHAAKSLGKKIVAAGNSKSCKELLLWSKDIVNHFWFACQKASSYFEFLDIWGGVIHHVVGEHEWALSYGEEGRNSCYHEPLDETTQEKSYLKKGSDAHKAITKIALDKRLLGHVHYYLNFRSTADLESFNNNILMYCAKRFAYSPPVYNARNILAALDHNHNVCRPVQKRKDGVERVSKHYSKKSGRWSVVPVKVDKSYEYVHELMDEIVTMRINDNKGMHRRVLLKEDDPRRLSTTIAPVVAPSAQELRETQVSRYKQIDTE